MDESGTWLLAANQDSASIVVFRQDPGSGSATAVGAPVTVPKPVCVLQAPPSR
jgi:6-phosphogluconolactonase